jgi:hypothetical protein
LPSVPEKLEGTAVMENESPKGRAARVEVQVFLEAVVDETSRGFATSVADPTLDRRRGLAEEHENAVGEQRMHQSVIIWDCDATTRVEIEGIAISAVARVPGPVAGLLAAVAQERRVRGHQLELVRRVSWIEDLGRRILVQLCMILLLLGHLKGHTYNPVG